MIRTALCTLLVTLMAVSGTAAGGEIHGTIETTDGKSYTGPIRWGGDEAFWDDTLDARKTEVIEEQKEDGFEFSLFGWKIIDSGGGTRLIRGFSVPFGHLRAVEPLPDGSALITFKSGEETEIGSSGTSDLGRRMDAIIVEEEDGGEVEFRWYRIKRVKFSQGPGEGRDAQRIHGTVVLQDETKLTGFIIWDSDERMLSEILDGNEGGTEHEVPFSEIKQIERLTRGSRVLLKNDEELVLTGTNDVDEGHRGVSVLVAGTGLAEVEWEDVARVVFSDPPPSRKYAQYDGGRRLHGTVRGGTLIGESTGQIVWDRDEIYTWENLDGESDSVKWAIPFENIRSIVPKDETGVEVTLANDQVLELFGSNDVDSSNRGIVVTSKKGNTKTEMTLTWDEVTSVEFD